jgi:hypothetical protein
VSPNRGARATRGYVMLMHSPFCLAPPKGGATDRTPKACLEKLLPDVVEREGNHVARSAFDERAVGSQVSQIIDGGVDIREIVTRPRK